MTLLLGRSRGFTMVTFMPRDEGLPPGSRLSVVDPRGHVLQRGVVQTEFHPRLTSVAGQTYQETAMSTTDPAEQPRYQRADEPGASDFYLFEEPPPLHGHYDRVVFYRDRAGKWRWRFRAAGNGRIMGDSGQGYAVLTDAWVAAERVTRSRLIYLTPGDVPGPLELPGVVWK